MDRLTHKGLNGKYYGNILGYPFTSESEQKQFVIDLTNRLGMYEDIADSYRKLGCASCIGCELENGEGCDKWIMGMAKYNKTAV
jgi:hypothetical protein